MLPRRGICLAYRAKCVGFDRAGHAARLLPRQFSSAARPGLSRSSSPRLGAFAPLQRPLLANSTTVANSILLPSVSHLQKRLQSTVQSASQNQSTSLDTPIPPSDVLNQTLDSPLTAADSLSSWYVGYMHDAGLDFGWGTSTMMQWAFEHIQVWGGYEVGVTILILAVIQRLVTFPLVIQAADVSTRFRRIQPEFALLQKEAQKATVEKNTLRAMQMRRAMADLRTKHNIKLWKMFLPMVQMPLGFGAWRMLRNATYLPAPGFETGGFLWFQCLVVSDPYFVLPVLTGAFQHLVVRFGGEMGGMSRESLMRQFMLYGLPCLSVFVTAMAPAAVQVTFVSAAFLSLCTNMLLRSESFRAMVGVGPRVPNVKTAEQIEAELKQQHAQSVYKGTITVAKNVKPKSPRSFNTSSAPEPEPEASSMLNPLNWFRRVGKAAKDTSSLTGGVLPSISSVKQRRQKEILQEKEDALETKRATERAKQKAEYLARVNAQFNLESESKNQKKKGR